MGLTRRSAAVDNRRKSIRTWQDRFRDPALTVLLVMELCLVFLATPLAAEQVPLAKLIVQTMVLVVVVIVVMLSQRRGRSWRFCWGWQPPSRASHSGRSGHRL
jgi:hypothetical protein